MTSRGRAFCFTLNNYDDEDIERLDRLECQYLVYGYEEAPSTGTPHLQGYIYWANAKTFKVVARMFKWHIELAGGTPDQNFDYASKEGEYYERGVKPLAKEANGQAEKERWDLARAAAKEGKFEDIPSEMYIRYQNSFKRMRIEDLDKAVDLPTREKYGLWIWGPPGVGKSHKARNDYQDLYLKDMNKWWDGYQGEKNVLIDEICPTDHFMGAYIKKWADKWTFSAEYKGGRKVIRPELIIITSNYSVDEVFHGKDLEAIKRRFTIMHLT
ncbi:MAG: helicase [Cressdnaviricota sp.]|nr:MAG: helicase [Cressdnaviricota sp.]